MKINFLTVIFDIENDIYSLCKEFVKRSVVSTPTACVDDGFQPLSQPSGILANLPHGVSVATLYAAGLLPILGDSAQENATMAFCQQGVLDDPSKS